jgi:signal transduction histidine kinase
MDIPFSTEHFQGLKLVYLVMPRLLFFLFFSCWATASLGQEKTIWLSEKQLAEKGYYRNHGFTKGPVKMGLLFNNTDSRPKTQYLKINNPHVNDLFLETINADTLYATGDHHLFNTRPVFFWDYILPVTTGPGKTDSLLLTLDNSGETQVYNLTLLNPDQFERKKLGDTFFFVIILSVSLIFSLGFLILGLYKKEKISTVFSIYILVSVLWILNINGILFQLVWPNNVFIQHAARVFFSSCSISVFVYYFICFYKDQISNSAKVIFTTFIVFLLMRIVFVLGLPNLFENARIKYILLIMGTVTIVIGLLLLLFYLLKFFKKGQFLFHNLGFAINFIFVLKEGLKLTGVDIFPFPENDEYVSAATHFLIIGFFSVSNVQQYRKKKQEKILMDLEASHRQDKAMTEKIIAAQEHERSAIGKNIHDQVGGLLAVMKIKMQTLKVQRKDEALHADMDQFIGLVDQCSNELHDIVDDLIPPEFASQDLSQIIKERTLVFEKATGIHFQYHPIPLNVNQQIGLKVYRIVCELITNSIKHAQCDTIQLTLVNNNGALLISHRDNGIGINQNKVQGKHGVNNIYSRVKFLEGTISVNTAPGETSYTINIPLANT